MNNKPPRPVLKRGFAKKGPEPFQALGKIKYFIIHSMNNTFLPPIFGRVHIRKKKNFKKTTIKYLLLSNLGCQFGQFVTWKVYF